jgi:hypothetical protein
VDTNSFEFSLSVPRDARFVPTVRELAVQAARYASCGDADAERFGGSVETAVRACLQESSSASDMSVVVRRDSGAVEVLVDGRTITVDP